MSLAHHPVPRVADASWSMLEGPEPFPQPVHYLPVIRATT